MKKYVLTVLIALHCPLFAVKENVHCVSLPPRDMSSDRLCSNILPLKDREVFDEIVNELRKAALEYYESHKEEIKEGAYAYTSQIVHRLPITQNHTFSMVITSIYDGKNFYEGLSSACMSHVYYIPADDVCQEMIKESLKMAEYSLFLHNY